MLLLHVSDIHFRLPYCRTPDQDPNRPYRTLVLQDVRARVTELGSSADAILIGGDIAFAGARDEYEAAMVWFTELAHVSGCELDRVFTVPGNHDVDRGITRSKPAVRNAQAAIARAEYRRREGELLTQIGDEHTASALLSPLTEYNSFAKHFNCQVYLPDRLCWKQDLELENGATLRMHGLTSTLLSGPEGNNDTRGDLYLSPLQTVLDPVDDVVNLVLCHHPPDWLMDQDDVEDAIGARAAIQMFGHKHRQRITRERGYVRFSAGAINPDRNERGWQPGYNLVDVRVKGFGPERKLVIESHLMQWQSSPDRFRPVLTNDSESIFRHSIRFPGTQPDRRNAIAVGDRPVHPPDGRAEKRAFVSLERLDVDVEATMGDKTTRDLVFRFWNLTSSQRREIALRLALITAEEIDLPEPERYSRALIRAGKRGELDKLAQAVAREENTDGRN